MTTSGRDVSSSHKALPYHNEVVKDEPACNTSVLGFAMRCTLALQNALWHVVPSLTGLMYQDGKSHTIQERSVSFFNHDEVTSSNFCTSQLTGPRGRSRVSFRKDLYDTCHYAKLGYGSPTTFALLPGLSYWPSISQLSLGRACGINMRDVHPIR